MNSFWERIACYNDVSSLKYQRNGMRVHDTNQNSKGKERRSQKPGACTNEINNSNPKDKPMEPLKEGDGLIQ